MPDLPVLSYGSEKPAVTILKAMLQSQGLSVDGGSTFGPTTLRSVKYFQGTHLGSDGRYLVSDGVVGPKTWWSLQNPSGPPQRSYLSTVVPKGLIGGRLDMLNVAAQQHAQDIHEIPDGSNWGDGVTKYLEGVGPNPWCCFCQSWLHKEATGKYPFGRRYGLVAALWTEAIARGRARRLHTGYRPFPGDLMIFLYRNASGRLTGTGHVSLVAAVDHPDKPLRFNTFGGNEGNRLKAGLRVAAHESALVGFVRLFDDDPDFEHGLFSEDEAGGGTR